MGVGPLFRKDRARLSASRACSLSTATKLASTEKQNLKKIINIIFVNTMEVNALVFEFGMIRKTYRYS